MALQGKNLNDNFARNDFLAQGTILAAAGIIVRIIGIFYRIPMINIIGEEGNGYYTSAYSIYSLFLILSSYSFPVALSKILSYRFSKKEFGNGYKVFKVSLLLATIIGALMFVIMYFGASVIANIVKKPFLKFSLQVFAPTLWVMAYLSVFRGLFQGSGTMVPTAFSQIIEQIVNAIISLVCCYIFFNQGLLANIIYGSTEYSYAFGAKGATVGTLAGASAALLVLIILFFAVKGRLVRASKQSGSNESIKNICFAILFTVAPIILSSTIYNCFAVISDIVYSNLVSKYGDSANMIANWGVFGQYHLLFNIPVAFASALTSSIIPAITHAIAKKDGSEATKRIKYSIRFTILILLPSVVGLSVLAYPICNLLFGSAKDSLLVHLTQFGSLSVLFYGLATITSGILQSLDRMKKPIIHGAIGLGVATILLAILIVAFKMDIFAVVIANMVFALIIAVLNLVDILRIVSFQTNIFQAVIFPVISALIMGVVTYLFNGALIKIIPEKIAFSKVGLTLIIVLTVFIAIVIYTIFLLVFGCIRRKDLAYYPLFSKIGRLVRQ